MIEPTVTPINVAAAGVSNIIPSMPGYRIVILELVIYNVVAQNIQFFQDNSPLMGNMVAFPANSGFTRMASLFPMWPLQPGRAFNINCSVGTQVSGYVLWAQVPAQEDVMRYIMGYSQVLVGPLTAEQRQALLQAIGGVI